MKAKTPDRSPISRLRGAWFLSAVAGGILLSGSAVLAGQDGKSTDAKAQQQGMDRQTTAPYRVSSWIGKPVHNPGGEQLGKIQELIMDDYGMIRYGIVRQSADGEKADRLVAVPLGHFSYRPGKSPELTIDISSRDMAQAPAFRDDDWPSLGEPRWSSVVITYWVSPEAAGRMAQAERAGGTQTFHANRDMVYLSDEREQLFNKLDKDADAAIEWEEAKSHDRLAREFDRLDTYSNDRITRSEFAMFEPRMEEQ
jgi:hypothetical protein